jgi:hypothetical protein
MKLKMSIKRFAELHNTDRRVVAKHMGQGFCPWPEYVGIKYHPSGKLWVAMVDGAALGQYDTDVLAARAYNAKVGYKVNDV